MSISQEEFAPHVNFERILNYGMIKTSSLNLLLEGYISKEQFLELDGEDKDKIFGYRIVQINPFIKPDLTIDKDFIVHRCYVGKKITPDAICTYKKLIKILGKEKFEKIISEYKNSEVKLPAFVYKTDENGEVISILKLNENDLVFNNMEELEEYIYNFWKIYKKYTNSFNANRQTDEVLKLKKNYKR